MYYTAAAAPRLGCLWRIVHQLRACQYPEQGTFVLKNHSLITTLRSLTGNPRGCVYTEPLWGIPFNLYVPYVSIYMLALGLSDTQIGTILSISWGFQIIMAFLSGVITDKLGRRRTTLIFDI